jgi:hypothetical protein
MEAELCVILGKLRSTHDLNAVNVCIGSHLLKWDREARNVMQLEQSESNHVIDLHEDSNVVSVHNDIIEDVKLSLDIREDNILALAQTSIWIGTRDLFARTSIANNRILDEN